MTEDSLDDFFEGDESVDDSTDNTAGETQPDLKANTADEPKEESKDEETGSPPDDKSDADKGVYETMKAERIKRQEVEAQVQTLQQQNADLKEKTDVWDDPEAFIDSRLAEQQNAFDNKFLNMSEHHAKQRYNDFDEKKDHFFNEVSETNPSLLKEALNQPDPYDFIYNESKRHLELKDIGDIDDYKARIRAEIEAEVKEGKNAGIEEAIKKRLDLPGSLSNERAAGGNSNPEFKLPNADSYFNDG